MAERSKAVDSSSILSGGVGSNPTPSICFCVGFKLFCFESWSAEHAVFSIIIGVVLDSTMFKTFIDRDSRYSSVGRASD